MELLAFLPNLALEELLFVADRDGVKTHSRISRCIVQADLARAINIHTVHFGEDPMGRQLALEVRIDVERKITRNVSEEIREKLREHQIAEEHLNDTALYSALGALLYENKDLKVPKVCWYYNSTAFFMMSRENFLASSSLMFEDDIPEELIWYQAKPHDNPLFFLDYQTTEDLLLLAKTLPFEEPFFETRIGALNCLSRHYENIADPLGRIIVKGNDRIKRKKNYNRDYFLIFFQEKKTQNSLFGTRRILHTGHTSKDRYSFCFSY